MKKEIVDISTIGAQRKRKKRTAAIVSVLLALFGVVLVLFWVIRWSPVFSVREVVVLGTSNMTSVSVENAVLAAMFTGASWKTFLGVGHLWAWPRELHGNDLRMVPEVSKITIEKDYEKRTVTLRAEERPREGIWCFEREEPKECFWFDRDGIIFQKAFSGGGSLITVVHDLAQMRVPFGMPAIENHFFENLRSIFDSLRDSELRVKEIRIEDLLREEVLIATYDGPRVMASLRFPLRGVAEALLAIKKEKNIETLEYLDFRVEGRVYYR